MNSLQMENEISSPDEDNNNEVCTSELQKESEKVSSTSTEKRKSSKPLMEKRRRARINDSLSELKTFLLDAIKKEGMRHNKMEKADILELTVKQLRQLQRQQFSSNPNSDTFRIGFIECATEVSTFLKSLPNIEPDLQAKLLEHLSKCSSDKSIKPTRELHSSPSISGKHTDQETSSSNDSFYCYNQKERYSNQPSNHSDESERIQLTSGLKRDYCLSPESLRTVEQPNIIVQSPSTSNGIIQNTGSINFREINTMQNVPINSELTVGNIFSGFKVLPVKLQSGETTFIIPTNIVPGSSIQNCVFPVMTSIDWAKISTQPQSLFYMNTSLGSSMTLKSGIAHNVQNMNNRRENPVGTSCPSESNILNLTNNERRDSSQNNMTSNRNSGHPYDNRGREETHRPVWRPF
ncbi:transcription hes-4 factor, partial [Mytilus galloprovincialis]